MPYGNLQGLQVQLLLNAMPSVYALQPDVSIMMGVKVETSGALNVEFGVRLETTEGTTLYLSVNLRVSQIFPNFIISPPSINTRIIRGNANIFQFNVTNVGSVEATSVKAILPETDFISLISFGTQQQAEGDFTLGSEESAILSILVQTPSNQELDDIKGNIIASSKETLKSIPLTLIVSSNLIMNFTVRVEDEYTYFAAGEPLVSNAVVRLVNYQHNIRITETTEDSGTVTFIDIPAPFSARNIWTNCLLESSGFV